MSGARRSRWFIAAAFVLVLAVAGYRFAFREQEYRRFERPDGRYVVIVYRTPTAFGAMPGQAGDAPGRVAIVDASGRTIHEQRLEMAQLADQVEWEPRAVRIPAVGIWDLPD